jgi:hypothetical protein
MWTYPRYHVELGQIPLFETGVHRFQLTGLPSEKMTLELVALGKAEKDRAELTGLKTKITATLVDDRGHFVCKASGSPSDGIRENAWILTSSDVSAAFYNHSCADVQIRRRTSYTLELTLTEVDSDSPKTFLAPVIAGGGNELP